MNIKETSAIMDVLSIAYPNYYRGLHPDDIKKAIALWTEMFKDNEARMVTAAVKALIATSESTYPPNIGQVKAYIRKIYGSEEMNEMAAWAEVRRAVKRSIYFAKDEFDDLSPLVQKTVGSYETLREWATTDEDVLGTVVASNFMRAYRAQAQSKKEFDALPEDIKTMISGLAERMKIE